MRTIIVFMTILTFSTISNGQGGTSLRSEQREVLATVQELFEAYRVGDSTRVRATFDENAVMIRASYKEGKSVTSKGSVDGFVKYVGGGLEQLHDELLWDYTISVDDNLANVWTRYAFFLDGKFHHCGSETFALHKSENGWKIIFLADNSMVEECDIPQEIMAKGTK